MARADPPHGKTRRQFIASVAGAAGIPLLCSSRRALGDDVVGLGAIAKRFGFLYGAATQSAILAKDEEFAAAFARECALVVPEGEAKWEPLQPQEGVFNFGPLDALARFASSHKMQLRGHCFVWHGSMPQWLGQQLAAGHGEQLLERHISTVARRYKGMAQSWDVVNEAIEPKDGNPLALRSTPFFEALGPRYLELAFQIAHAADPTATLVYNDYGVEYDSPDSDERRKGVLELLAHLKNRGAPVRALGIQAHLTAGHPIDPEKIARFIREVADLGFSVYITELDVRDIELHGPDRAEIVGKHVEEFLGVVLSETSVKAVITWGLSDRYSWLNSWKWSRRPDGDLVHGLPLDGSLRRQPMWFALARAFEAHPH